MDKPLIAVFGANPAWQKTLHFKKFRPGEVNRASGLELYAGGKGVNFCRAAGCRGLCRTRLFQFAGGANGALHEAELAREGIDVCSIRVAAGTRCCTTCLDEAGSPMTELIEPSHAVTDREAGAMLNALDSQLSEASGAAITGSLPDGTDPELYTRVAEVVAKHDLPLLVDALSPGATAASAKVVLKINMDELKKLTGEGEAASALRCGASRWKNAILAITDGASAAYLASGGKFYRYHIPRISVVSALGAGDTCSAVLLSGILTGQAPHLAFAEALAAASANCLSATAGEFSNADCAKLMPQIEEL